MEGGRVSAAGRADQLSGKRNGSRSGERQAETARIVVPACNRTRSKRNQRIRTLIWTLFSKRDHFDGERFCKLRLVVPDVFHHRLGILFSHKEFDGLLEKGTHDRIHSHAHKVSVFTEGNQMAKKTVFVSDLSGETIEDGKGAKVRITYGDARRGAAELDVTDREADELARKGRRVARRGRRPSAT